jgi:hypothetical protein
LRAYLTGELAEGEMEEADEEKLMEELQAALVKSALDADQAFTLRIKMATSLSLRVNLGAQTIVTVVVAVRFCSEKRRNLQRYILELDNLSVRDMVSTRPLFKYIMSTDKSLLNSKVLKRASILQTNGAVTIPAINFEKTEKVGDGFTDGSAQLSLLFEKKKGDSVEKGTCFSLGAWCFGRIVVGMLRIPPVGLIAAKQHWQLDL